MTRRQALGRDLSGLSRRRFMVEWASVAVFVVVLMVLLSLSSAMQRLDALGYDLIQRATAPAPRDDIVIVAIDDRSLAELGGWPFARSVHAQAIDHLREAGVRAVAYDVLFLDPTPDDDVLGASLKRAGDVHVPLIVDAPGDNGAPWREQRPPQSIASGAASLNQVNLAPDSDGVVRRQPLYLEADGVRWDHLVLPLARAGGARVPPPSTTTGAGLRATTPLPVRYVSGARGFRTAAFVDLVRDETPRAILRDKLVLVGATAPGLGDRYATPTNSGQLTPGVEIQASLLQTLLNGDAPRIAPPGVSLALGLTLLGVLFAGFLRLSPTANLLLAVAVALCGIAICVGLYLGAALWVSSVPLLVGILIALPLWSWRRLAATAAHVEDELKALRHRPELLSRARTSVEPGDALERQMLDLRFAVTRLQDLEHFISDTLHGLPDAVAVCDLLGRVVMLNRHAEAMFGPAVDQASSVQDIQDRLRLPDGEMSLTSIDGPIDVETQTGRILSVVTAPLHASTGERLGWIMQFSDVSKARAAELQRERALQLLSHDMRAPQVSILTLLNQDSTDDEATFRRRLKSCAQQTLDLADGYVQLARAEIAVYRSALIDLRDILQEAADTLWPLSMENGAEIVLPEAGEPLLVSGDAVLLRRMMINLFENALKYGPVGGKVVCAVTLLESEAARHVHIAVIDEGPGVPPERQAALFEAFSSVSDHQRSLGLGLALVRTVARRHGGEARYEGSETTTRFVVELPLADDDIDKASAAASDSASRA